MVIGDSASGKSSFAKSLGQKLNIPVIHIDEINDSIGRNNPDKIQNTIRKEANKNDWIFDGNGFTKDKTYRLNKTDIIFVFNSNKFVTLWRVFYRHLKIKLGKEKRIGSLSEKFSLKYFIPYIFFKFPRRKQEAVSFARKLNKKIFIFNNKKEAWIFLEKRIKEII